MEAQRLENILSLYANKLCIENKLYLSGTTFKNMDIEKVEQINNLMKKNVIVLISYYVGTSIKDFYSKNVLPKHKHNTPKSLFKKNYLKTDADNNIVIYNFLCKHDFCINNNNIDNNSIDNYGNVIVNDIKEKNKKIIQSYIYSLEYIDN